MNLKIKIKTDFDLDKNLKYRPFLFEINGKLERKILVNNKLFFCKIYQKRKTVFVSGVPPEVEKETRKLISTCLGINEDLKEFYELAEKDAVLSEADIKGLRIFSAPTKWETLFCIILSQMTSFNQYKKTVYSVYQNYGCFPTQEQVIKNPKKLEKCRVGYRKKFIVGCAKVFSGRLEGNLPGIGEYSKKIYKLFAERDFSSYYDDVLIRKILREKYNNSSLERFGKKWGKYAGMAEVFLQKFLADNPTFKSSNSGNR